MDHLAFLALALAVLSWGLGFPLGKLGTARTRSGAYGAAPLHRCQHRRLSIRPCHEGGKSAVPFAAGVVSVNVV